MRLHAVPAPLLLLCCGVLCLCSCGDDEASVTGPDEPDDAAAADAAVLLEQLTETVQMAFFQSLVQDPVAVPGRAGHLTITGDTWVFDAFSTDGELFIDGQMTVVKARFPEIPVTGTVSLSGSHTGTLVADLLARVQGTSLHTSGTVELNGTTYDAETLQAQE